MPQPTITNLALGVLYKLFIGDDSGEEEANRLPELAEIAPVIRLKHKAGAVVLIIGRRESGKTIAAQRLAEIIGKPTYAVSPEQSPPSWITELKLEELATRPPPNTTLILDDIPVYASQRDYNNPFVRVLETIIPVCRHKRRLTLIFSSQSSSLSDRYIMDADLVFLKNANLLYMDLERPSVAKLYKWAMPIFNQMSEYQQKRHIAVVSQNWRGLVRVEKPKDEREPTSKS